jgi:uncharacterized protein with WD repeat
VKKGKKVKTFTIPKIPVETMSTQLWPIYKWSGNEKYFARISIDSIW